MDKRKRVVLPIEKKLKIISKFQKGHTVKTIIIEYNVHEATVRGIIKLKEAMLKFACLSDSSPSMKKRKTMKKSTYKNLDKALLEWFNNQRAIGNPVNDPILATKAKDFFTSLGLEAQFEASSGWLPRFKIRHGIRELDIQEEILSGKKDAAVEICVYFK
uniref:HTH CENPB-type domain-containing protein n=1 Tax=Graphocephala atropunctata TaxID=36148 RepID=A0A1B6KPK0_9HEMI